MFVFSLEELSGFEEAWKGNSSLANHESTG